LKRKKSPFENTDTLIGKESVIEGKIRSESNIRIEGQVKGNINCEGDCIISESGVVESAIFAHNVSIAGKVVGEIHASGKVTILSSGTLVGNCHATTFIIEEGGIFHGQSHMMETTDKSETPE